MGGIGRNSDLKKKINLRTILNGLLLAIAMYFVIGICIQTFLEIYFGEVDLSSVDDIRGNFVSFFILFLIMWVFAASWGRISV